MKVYVYDVVDIATIPPLTLFLTWFKKKKKRKRITVFFFTQRLESNFTVPLYLFEEQMNFPWKPQCCLVSNRCLSVCIASWVINPGFRSTKFGCSRFLSTLSWDSSVCVHQWGAPLSIFDVCQPQEVVSYKNDMEYTVIHYHQQCQHILFDAVRLV